MSTDKWYDELTEHLQSKGYSATDVEKILARVKRYDLATQSDSIMDLIGSGDLDLGAIIQDALGKE